MQRAHCVSRFSASIGLPSAATPANNMMLRNPRLEVYHMLCCQVAEQMLQLNTLSARCAEHQTHLSVPRPAHGRVIDAVDVAVRRWRVVAICHALHIVVSVQVIKGVLRSSSPNWRADKPVDAGVNCFAQGNLKQQACVMHHSLVLCPKV